MWLMTPVGFFSIVCKAEDKKTGTLTIRSRVREDLLALQATVLPGMGAILENAGSDYRFRAVAPRKEVAAAMAEMVMQLDYDNFKNAVAKRQGKPRAHVYGEVWSVLYGLQAGSGHEQFGKGGH